MIGIVFLDLIFLELGTWTLGDWYHGSRPPSRHQVLPVCSLSGFCTVPCIREDGSCLSESGRWQLPYDQPLRLMRCWQPLCFLAVFWLAVQTLTSWSCLTCLVFFRCVSQLISLQIIFGSPGFRLFRPSPQPVMYCRLVHTH